MNAKHCSAPMHPLERLYYVANVNDKILTTDRIGLLTQDRPLKVSHQSISTETKRKKNTLKQVRRTRRYDDSVRFRFPHGSGVAVFPEASSAAFFLLIGVTSVSMPKSTGSAL